LTRPPVILIVDVSQGLEVNILEMLRGLWDEGDLWRMGQAYAPAFGLMLVGNDTFLARTGRARRAEYRPLVDRISFPLDLGPPSERECRDFAAALVPGDAEAIKMLAEFGVSRGNLRGMEKAFLQARFYAGGDGRANAAAVRKALFHLKGVK
jgi:hypothetical protein